MEWIHVLTIIGANFAFVLTLWLWQRAECSSDRKEIASAVILLANDIRTDMKDFHGRLCTIEERNRSK